MNHLLYFEILDNQLLTSYLRNHPKIFRSLLWSFCSLLGRNGERTLAALTADADNVQLSRRRMRVKVGTNFLPGHHGMSATKPNRAPHVPNHEMVRSIGRGAYGEIWLARSLTDTWRAVKVVDRRTFESEKAFQREFEGMAMFEPFSREEPGFVDILHVGRDEGGHFFYYVMELADDHLSCGGASIDPARYAPKTLKSELGRRSRLLVDECLTIGLSLTSALAALHRQGLVHRDIKPANIIFVGGVPKIADIGLVAAHGQDSFVGTEGYMPPEGPGSVQADIYSLGKVLYEIAMGKDRHDFPAVNSRIDDLPDRTGLLQLNEVLLRACASHSAERYPTATKMHEDLLRVRDGRPLPRRWSRTAKVALVGVALLGLAVAGGYGTFQRRMRGQVMIETDPPGAMVVCSQTMRKAPARFDQLRLGSASAHVMLAGYEPKDVSFEVESGTQPRPIKVKLARSRGAAKLDSQPTGAAFELRMGETVVTSGKLPAELADLPTGPYQIFCKLDGREESEAIEIKRGELTEKTVEFGTGRIQVASRPAGAEILLDGQPAGPAPLELTVPEGPHELVAKYRQWPALTRTITAKRGEPLPAAFEFIGGSVKITSAPGGATVLVGERELGRTPLLVQDLEPGDVSYELRLAGYKPLAIAGAVKPGEQTFLGARFVQRSGPQRGEPWENSLGMKFVPVGDVLMAVWPTRVQDYEAFCAERGRARTVPDFAQDPNHPVVKVNWEDASDFCAWLTRKELEAGQLEEGQQYRLPKDQEWSLGVGLADEGRETPEQRDGKCPDFPWGKTWPPTEPTGNYADTSMKKAGVATIAGYHDGFAQTSPVGTYPANALGLFDMGGNVWQWCEDSYKGGAHARDWGVLRGGSWATATPAELRSSYRNVVDRAERDVIFGFRCVLVPDTGR
jgi:formylglycine-generating enzyme required for sulfatase activity